MFRRLRWLMIVVPALAVGAIELVSDSLLDTAFPLPLDTVLIVAVVAALAAAFSVVMFRRIDALTTAFAAQKEELEARNASARALHHVSVAITALADLDRVLQAVVDSARELLGADVAVLLLAGPDAALAVRASSGPPGALRPAGGQPGFSDTGSPADDADDADDDALRFVDPAFAVARLAAPLQRGGRTIGLVVVGSAIERTFGVDDVETLASLANQGAIAIENARLQERLRGLAVVEERERIAREMHDGLAQVLGYVSTKSQAVEEYLATGRIDEARGQLGELSSAARSVYVDVREAILGLRSPIDPAIGLVGAVEAYARRFAEASKLAVVVDSTPESRAVALAPEAQAQVFRIVQESLTNVRKHAAAGRAGVRIAVEDGALLIRVFDDGRGLATPGRSPAGSPVASAAAAPAGSPAVWPRYGLQAMRERAAAIGGSVEWSSRPGSGVEVRITVPVADSRMTVPVANAG